MKDSKGNIVAVTLFESYLSKYLIENKAHFELVHQKILSAIEHLFILNKDNDSFNRILFGIFSLLKEKYNYSSMDELKDNFNLFADTYFIKLFCDAILHNKSLNMTFMAKESESRAVALSPSLSQCSLFKSSDDIFAKMVANFRIPVLFNKNRGAKEVGYYEPMFTRKFGITDLEHTPSDLSSYFDYDHEPSQFLYVPDRKSTVGKWFTQHNLPIISGTSGSAADILSLISISSSLSHEEIKLFMIAQAALLVGEGHHSYFEIIIIWNSSGFNLQSTENLFAFYEQTLPECITATASYNAFKNSSKGASLLEGIEDEPEQDVTVSVLPSVSIGSAVLQNTF